MLHSFVNLQIPLASYRGIKGQRAYPRQRFIFLKDGGNEL